MSGNLQVNLSVEEIQSILENLNQKTKKQATNGPKSDDLTAADECQECTTNSTCGILFCGFY